MACGFIRKRRYELFVRWKHIRRISCENRAAAHPGRGFLCSGRGVSRAGGYMFGPVASPGRSPCSGVEPLFRRARHRVGADRWERRGSAWTLCSGGAGRISVRVAAVSGRAGRIPRTQGLPSSRAAPSGRGPMLRFRTLLSFSAASRRAGTDAVCKSAVSPLGKSEKVVFYFYFIIKDVSLCSQNNT